jgi:hypothetical protein
MFQITDRHCRSREGPLKLTHSIQPTGS